MQNSDTESTPDYDGGGAREPAGLPMMAAHQAVLRPDLVGLAVAHECPPPHSTLTLGRMGFLSLQSFEPPKNTLKF